MIFNLNEQKVLSDPSGSSVFKGEKDFNDIVVNLPDNIDGHAATELNYVMHFVDSDGGYSTKILTVDSSGEALKATATVSTSITSKAQAFYAYVLMTDDEETVIGKTNGVIVMIHPVPDEENEIIPPADADKIIKGLEEIVKEATETIETATDTIEEATEAIGSKQDKLTAGENITISDDNVISAEGGVTSYEDLTDKPQINSVELSGNKTLDDLGMQAKIDNSHKLFSDLIDDTNNTNKFVTAQEKATWNGKEDASNKVTSISASSTNTEYPSAKCVYDMIVDKQKKIYFEQPKNDFRSTHNDGTPYDVGDIFFYKDVIYKINTGFANTGAVYYSRTVIGTRMGMANPPTTTPAQYAWEYKAGEEYIQYNTPQAANVFTPYKRFLCTQSIEVQTPSSYGSHQYTWVEIPLGTNLESVANKVTSLSVSSTDTQYPSAKCVYDAISASSGTVITSGVVNANGTITFTNSDGTTFTTSGTSVIGADGFSPTATVTQTASGATVSITDKNGTTTANISNGQDYILTTQDKDDIADIVLAEFTGSIVNGELNTR